MKKILCLLSAIILCFGITGCTKNKEKNIEGSLTEIMSNLYKGISEDEMPMMTENIELNSENFEYYAFSSDIKYKEAIASESMTGSTAHSVVLIRLEDKRDSKKVVDEIKEKANPRKWICVEAENTYVLSKDDLVVLIMSNELAPKIKSNFENLK